MTLAKLIASVVKRLSDNKTTVVSGCTDNAKYNVKRRQKQYTVIFWRALHLPKMCPSHNKPCFKRLVTFR